jgi:hypothetical protein
VKVNYSSYSSRLEIESISEEDAELAGSWVKKQQTIKNSPNFYHQAPFLTIAEDLLKLIREDKVEKLIFLIYCKVLSMEGEHSENVITDDRIELVFKETFAKLPDCSLRKIRFVEDNGGGMEFQYKKVD